MTKNDAMPQDQGLSQPKQFSGLLSREGNRVSVVAHISVDPTGEVVFAFDPISLTKESAFLLEARYDQGTVPATLRFSGSAPDQTDFETTDFHIERCYPVSDESGNLLALDGVCLTGTFRRPLVPPATAPVLRLHLRGFRSYGSHEATCPLGEIAIEVHSAATDINALSGSLLLRARTTPDDVGDWRQNGERLLEHIRRVMSLAAGALLRAPVIEFYSGEVVEIRMWSQTTQSSGALRAIHVMQQENIFAAAVESFFHPPLPVRHLFYAIEWFAMEGTYNEIRLVSAMTALENLINANLDESEVLIEEPRVFEKTRRILRRVVRKCLEKWPVEQAQDILDELNEKLADLNRRSLFRKLKMLATRWHVPLDDISDEAIKAAIYARNRVVHRGLYYEERADDDPSLWTHVAIIREIVVRFLFMAIGYRGEYISYIGRAHNLRFPTDSANNFPPVG